MDVTYSVIDSATVARASSTVTFRILSDTIRPRPRDITAWATAR